MSEQRKQQIRAMLGAFSMMSMNPDEVNRLQEYSDRDDFMEQTKVLDQHRPPSGTKEYFFNDQGEFATTGTRPMLRSETVFWCYAINDKNAKRKFNVWKTQNKKTS